MARREQFVRLTVDHSAGARWVWIWAPNIDRVDEYIKPGSSGARAVVHTRLDKLYVQEPPEEVLQLTQAEPQPAIRAGATAYAEGYQAGLKDAKPPERPAFWFGITGKEVYAAWARASGRTPDWWGLPYQAHLHWEGAAARLRQGVCASAIPTPAGSEVDRLAHAARVAFYEGELGAGEWEHLSERSKATWRRVARAVLGARP